MAGAKKQKNKTPMSIRLAFIILFLCALVFLPSTLLLGMCLLPMFVAYLVEPGTPKTLWITVGALNLAGTVPNLFHLWEEGHTIDAAFRLITQPETILYSYGAAAAGWILYLYLTPLVAGIVVGRAQSRIRDIEKKQKEFIRKWGDGIVG